MQIILNGEAQQIDNAGTVRQLVEQFGLDPRKVAVERNLAIVPQSSYDSTALSDGDRIEIVHFIGGG